MYTPFIQRVYYRYCLFIYTVGYYVGSLRSLAIFKQVERAKKERKSR